MENMTFSGTAFTAVWENVTLQDKPDFGKFTFSVTLHQSGDVVFAYWQVPTHINSIQDKEHPVKVGLSDAYIIDKQLYCEYSLFGCCATKSHLYPIASCSPKDNLRVPPSHLPAA